jgi:hypothetical protein
MNPFPGPNSVIVMDNCRIHKLPYILEMIEQRCAPPLLLYIDLILTCTFRGMRYVFLPPYSPDLNPIELAFSAIKMYIRRNGDLYRSVMSGRNTDEMLTYYQLHQAVLSVTPAHAAAWYRHCGYL